jgi:hypothetical protein
MDCSREAKFLCDNLSLAILVIILSPLIKKSCGIRGWSLVEKLVITG